GLSRQPGGAEIEDRPHGAPGSVCTISCSVRNTKLCTQPMAAPGSAATADAQFDVPYGTPSCAFREWLPPRDRAPASAQNHVPYGTEVTLVLWTGGAERPERNQTPCQRANLPTLKSSNARCSPIRRARASPR